MAITLDNQNNKIFVNGVELSLHYRTNVTPSGTVEEGHLWYDPDSNNLKVYREVSPATFEWVPIMIGDISADSDNIDAGAF
jgi:hypothetical protein